MELTGDDNVFPHLHKYFVFLLKAGGLRITESVLEGPPRVGAILIIIVCVCFVSTSPSESMYKAIAE